MMGLLKLWRRFHIHPGNRGKQYLKFSWFNYLRQEKQKKKSVLQEWLCCPVRGFTVSGMLWGTGCMNVHERGQQEKQITPQCLSEGS